MDCEGIVSEGDHIIFKTDEKTKVFQVHRTRNIFFEKAKFKGQELIGQKYGTLLEVRQGKLVVVTTSDGGSRETVAFTASGKDNRDLVASEENQKLSQGDIMKMKEEGVSGKDIVGKLVEQSDTFKTKTEFSQEKYIKKKKKKHMLVFRILQPNSRLLLDTYKHSAFKICNLRADSLSQLLCYSNVMPGSTVAVVESCQGLVLGSVMERMGGQGKVIHLYPGNDMNRHVVKDFGFPADFMKTLYDFPLNKLSSLEDGSLLAAGVPSADSTAAATAGVTEDGSSKSTVQDSDMADEESTKQEAGKSTATDKGPAKDEASKAVVQKDAETVAMESKDSDNDSAEDDARDDGQSSSHQEGRDTKGKGGKRKTERNQNHDARRHLRAEKIREAACVLQEKNLDSLIIATKHDPVAILVRLLPYVAPSRPVVVFCQHKEPLVECFSKVKENGWGIQLKLSESWYREYQVLPSRTHPLMSMSGTGGYLLSFFRVLSHQ